MSRIRRLLPTILFGGFVLAAAIPAQAQDFDDAGVVRVSDHVPTDLQPIPAGAAGSQGNCPHCQNGAAYGAPCPQGCPPGQCHGKHCKCGRCLHQIVDWFNPHGMCTFSPDHGFAPPVKRPIYRTPVVYRKQFPDSWTGAPGAGMAGGPSAPTVYMPTDTTQLGYYYQHVPYWQPNPGAIPPAPRPADWHLSMCQANLPGRHPAGVIIGTTPTMLPTPAVGAAPAMGPAPVDMQGLPPAPEPTISTMAGRLEKTTGAPALQPVQ